MASTEPPASFDISQVNGFYGPGACIGLLVAVATVWYATIRHPDKNLTPLVLAPILIINWAALDLFVQIHTEGMRAAPTAAALAITFWGFLHLYAQVQYLRHVNRDSGKTALTLSKIGRAVPFATLMVGPNSWVKFFNLRKPWRFVGMLFGSMLASPFLMMLGVLLTIFFQAIFTRAKSYAADNPIDSTIVSDAVYTDAEPPTPHQDEALSVETVADPSIVPTNAVPLLPRLDLGSPFAGPSTVSTNAAPPSPRLDPSPPPGWQPPEALVTAQKDESKWHPSISSIFSICGSHFFTVLAVSLMAAAWAETLAEDTHNAPRSCVVKPCAPQKIKEWDQAFSMLMGLTMFVYEVGPDILRFLKSKIERRGASILP